MNSPEGKRDSLLSKSKEFSTFHVLNHYNFDLFIRYARWSLGFVDPPLEIAGTGNRCKISALNVRGQVLLEPVLDTMNKLLESGTLSNVSQEGDVIDIEVAPPADVGTFSEEQRSRQVSNFLFIVLHIFCCLSLSHRISFVTLAITVFCRTCLG